MGIATFPEYFPNAGTGIDARGSGGCAREAQGGGRASLGVSNGLVHNRGSEQTQREDQRTTRLGHRSGCFTRAAAVIGQCHRVIGTNFQRTIEVIGNRAAILSTPPMVVSALQALLVVGVDLDREAPAGDALFLVLAEVDRRGIA